MGFEQPEEFKIQILDVQSATDRSLEPCQGFILGVQ